jgi:hypothetical protein
MHLRRPLVLSIATLTLITGCGGGSEPSSDSSESSDTGQRTTARESAAAEPAPEPAKGGGPTQLRLVLAEGDEDPVDSAEIDAGLADQYASFECSDGVGQPKSAAAAIACDASGTKYLLGPGIKRAAIARAVPYEFDGILSVGIILTDGSGRAIEKAAKATDASSVALLLGGVVLTAQPVGTVAARGRTEVGGKFTDETAHALAARMNAVAR